MSESTNFKIKQACEHSNWRDVSAHHALWALLLSGNTYSDPNGRGEMEIGSLWWILTACVELELRASETQCERQVKLIIIV